MKSFIRNSLSLQIKVARIMILIALVLSACTTESPAIEPTQESTSYDMPSVINATGVVVPSQWASISVQSNGLVEKLHVTEGQKVTAGEILMTLSGHDQLLAQLESAKLNHARNFSTCKRISAGTRCLTSLGRVSIEGSAVTVLLTTTWSRIKRARRGSSFGIAVVRADWTW